VRQPKYAQMASDRKAFDEALEEVFDNIRELGHELLEVEVEGVDSDDEELGVSIYFGRKDSIAARLAAEYDVLGALLFKDADQVRSEQAVLNAEWAVYRTAPDARPGYIRLGEIEGGIVDQVFHAERVRRAIEARESALGRQET